MKTYGIIVAMEKEATMLKETLKNFKETKILNNIFYESIYNNKKVIFTISGIGKVNAAIATTLLIDHYHPDLVINTGIAGAINRQLKQLDFIVAKEVMYSDVDMTSDVAGNYAYGQIQGLPKSFKSNLELIKNDKSLIEATIISGDQFVDNYEKTINLIHEKFPSKIIDACDMESASIAHTCYVNNTDFIIIRAISDVIGSTAPFDYMNFSYLTASKVAKYVLEILQ